MDGTYGSADWCRSRGYRSSILPIPNHTELLRRLPRLIVGLLLFGVGIAMLVIANLGLPPWEVMHQGISQKTGIPLGTVGIMTGIVVLLLWIPLKERIGIGTVFNVFLIGIVIDVALAIFPDSIDTSWLRWALMFGGVLVIAVGSGLYIGVGLGPGPRDGLMTGIARRGIPISIARGSIEITVLVAGYFLGGTVGIGTLVFAFGVGPLIAIFLPRLSMEPLYHYEERDPGRHEGAL